MTCTRYCTILKTVLPFVKNQFAGGHRFQQDNDPKHTSNYSKTFLLEKSINWWRTPAESPNLNPIENVWASLKDFLRYNHKPKSIESLVAGLRYSGRA